MVREKMSHLAQGRAEVKVLGATRIQVVLCKHGCLWRSGGHGIQVCRGQTVSVLCVVLRS